MIDQTKIESCVTELLIALGEDPNREGLKETPQRFARYMAEVMDGNNYTNDDLVNMYNKQFIETTSNDLVIVTNIPCFSFCEHHLALMYNMSVTVGYIPRNKVLGLSKITRIVQMVTKRLQIQERIGNDIFEILNKILNTEDIAIVINAEHSCMTARGTKTPGVITRTSKMAGGFVDLNNSILREEFLMLAGKQ